MLRAEIESRILANEPVEAIEIKTGVSADVVLDYERRFFAVRPLLHLRDLVLREYVTPPAMLGVNLYDVGVLWRQVGFTLGVRILDELIRVVDRDRAREVGISAYAAAFSHMSAEAEAVVTVRLASSDLQIADQSFLDAYIRQLSRISPESEVAVLAASLPTVNAPGEDVTGSDDV